MTEVPLGSILDHLRVLVAADSSDPATQVNPSHRAVMHVSHVLEEAEFSVSTDDLGGGCVNLLAVRGDADVHTGTLFNCHLDTVKVNPNWTRDPFTLAVEGDGDDTKAFGLGACDIKGAAACLLAVAEATDQPMAILFTTDEESGKGVCVTSFLKSWGERWSRVVVAEPTGARAVLQHRGFASFEIAFSGTPGHTSRANGAAGSAVHKAARWMNAALDLAEPGGVLDGSRFNIGIVNGGVASNVVASETKVRFGFRPEPDADAASLMNERVAALRALLPLDGSAVWTDRFLAPPLSSDDAMADAVSAWGLEEGPNVDFWTEAALFAAGTDRVYGLPAMVLGPGDIAQAHTADEFVYVSQLRACAIAYELIVRADGVRCENGSGAVSIKGESYVS
ncbi:MAG: M20/M25/M40 family metallo-hydrolase [Phycisphaera sp.]|nr:MAG: M20/M25/M40 family metallo-hydrolase [Phycisphaera sp.]